MLIVFLMLVLLLENECFKKNNTNQFYLVMKSNYILNVEEFVRNSVKGRDTKDNLSVCQ